MIRDGRNPGMRTSRIGGGPPNVLRGYIGGLSRSCPDASLSVSFSGLRVWDRRALRRRSEPGSESRPARCPVRSRQRRADAAGRLLRPALRREPRPAPSPRGGSQRRRVRGQTRRRGDRPSRYHPRRQGRHRRDLLQRTERKRHRSLERRGVFRADRSGDPDSVEAGELQPAGEPQIIAKDLPTGGHGDKGMALGPNNALFVSFGSLTNSCQPEGQDRQGPYPSPDPCPELRAPRRASGDSMRPSSNRPPPTGSVGPPESGTRCPSRFSPAPGPSTPPSMAAITSPKTGSGRPRRGGRIRRSVFGPVPQGSGRRLALLLLSNPRTKLRLLNPEYGGDGRKRWAGATRRHMPAVAFPAHWAPDAICCSTAERHVRSELSERRLHRLPRLLESGAGSTAGLSGGVRAVPSGKAQGTWQDFAVPSWVTDGHPADRPRPGPRRLALPERRRPGQDLADREAIAIFQDLLRLSIRR